MLLREDVEDDLLEGYPDYYTKDGQILVYRNGKDNDRYLVEVRVVNIGKED
jgi:hypothetical protein